MWILTLQMRICKIQKLNDIVYTDADIDERSRAGPSHDVKWAHILEVCMGAPKYRRQ